MEGAAASVDSSSEDTLLEGDSGGADGVEVPNDEADPVDGKDDGFAGPRVHLRGPEVHVGTHEAPGRPHRPQRHPAERRASTAEQEIRIVANDFLAGGTGGFTAFAAGKDVVTSIPDVAALEQYFLKHSPVKPPALDRVAYRLPE